jgi:hypothetical protein
MNRMRCKTQDGATWTMVRVRELRERLGIAPYDPATQAIKTISVDETAQRLKICVGSVHLLIRQGVLPATQLMPSAPWKVPVAALDTEAVKTGVRAIVARRPKNYLIYKHLRDRGCSIFEGGMHCVTRPAHRSLNRIRHARRLGPGRKQLSRRRRRPRRKA